MLLLVQDLNMCQNNCSTANMPILVTHKLGKENAIMLEHETLKKYCTILKAYSKLLISTLN